MAHDADQSPVTETTGGGASWPHPRHLQNLQKELARLTLPDRPPCGPVRTVLVACKSCKRRGVARLLDAGRKRARSGLQPRYLQNLQKAREGWPGWSIAGGLRASALPAKAARGVAGPGWSIAGGECASSLPAKPAKAAREVSGRVGRSPKACSSERATSLPAKPAKARKEAFVGFAGANLVVLRSASSPVHHDCRINRDDLRRPAAGFLGLDSCPTKLR